MQPIHFAMVRKNLFRGVKRARKDSKVKSAADMVPLMHKFAPFANSSYERNLDSREKKLKKALGANSIHYEMDRDLSNKELTVWIDPENREVITTNRGTKELDDYGTDLALAFGMESLTPRYRRNKKAFRNIKEKYDHEEGWKHSLVGHSLGATLNNALYQEFEDSIEGVYNFNPGSSAKHARGGIEDALNQEFHEKIHNFQVQGDPLSVAGLGATFSTNMLVIPPKAGKKGNLLDAHRLDNFIE